MPEKDAKGHIGARAAALISRLRALELPDAAKGLKGEWLAVSCAVCIFVITAVVCAARGAGGWAAAFAVLSVLLLLASNLWFRERVTSPILGLGDTARRIAEGSYGSLAEKFRDDEVGALTEAINDMSQKIGEASRVQSEFVSSVSHELRTPLTAITGWGETLLYDEALQDDSRRGAEIICAEASRLTSMVEELLEFTRLRDGRFALELGTVDLAALIEEVDFTYSERHPARLLPAGGGAARRHGRRRAAQAGAAEHTGQRRQIRPQRPARGALRRRGGRICAHLRARPRPGHLARGPSARQGALL